MSYQVRKRRGGKKDTAKKKTWKGYILWFQIYDIAEKAKPCWQYKKKNQWLPEVQGRRMNR